MSKNYTLKELADMFAYKRRGALADGQSIEEARMLALKHVLNAIGYEFPKDEEREAFDAWCNANHKLATTDQFEAWKAGREELRRSINKPTYSMPNNYGGIAFLASQQVDLTTEQQKAVDACLKEELSLAKPAWIPWGGGGCPLPDGVKRWEAKFRSGTLVKGGGRACRWNHFGNAGDIVAYRVIE